MISRHVGFCPRALPGLRGRGPFISRPIIITPRCQPSWTPRAWESTAATDDTKTGHIVAAPNESILWFDNLFPLKLSSLLRVPWRSPDRDLSELMRRFESSTLGIMDPINMVKRAIPETTPWKVTEILPRIKDGGAFVKLTHPADVPATEIAGTVSKTLEENPVRPFFSPFRRVNAGLVQGVPWLEDLHRFPKSRLRVEFVPKNPGEEAVELSQETLYSLFRRYGKITEITSQPWDSKVLPKFAYVDFALVRDAIMARNCLHGYVVPEELGGGKSGTKFRMSYERRVKPHRFWDWITSHPRIVIPVVVALLTGLTVAVFDPIRSFFVRAHVTQKYRLSNSRLYRWLRKQTSDIFTFRRQNAEQAGLSAVWTHRKDLINQIQKWLMETAQTFIVVQGPRGSGKKELVLEQALKGRNNVLVIDCKPIVEARGESATIKKLASAVGYRPIFSWANSLSSMIDLAVQGTTGVKAGFSETLESQLQKILQTTAGALTEIDVSHRHKTDSDGSLPVDAYLEAHPERRAVVVIDNFLHKGDSNAIVYDKIAEWAAALVQSNVAHVIFLTNDASYSKSLSKSLPDRVFRQAALGDLSPEVAKRFILSHVQGDEAPKPGADGLDAFKQAGQTKPKVRPNLEGLDDCIGTLGGRLTDLEFLARRLKAGQEPKQAVAEIIEQSASEILKMFLLSGKASSTSAGGSGAQQHRWSVEQAWYLVKALSHIGGDEDLRYNEVLLSDTFAKSQRAPDGEAALEGLADAELITIRSSAQGRPQSIAAGCPVYAAAFRLLASDPALAAKLDLAVLTERAAVETKAIDKAERELCALSEIPKLPAQTAARVSYLLEKIQTAQNRIEAYEKEMAGLKKVLSSQY
ncbi:RNA12 protein-domain-containing protein [Xylariaceae sp. FL0662B]|nr:RNA12 protein-domain-containing protein [Xylariaceae sp. FL0662B]